MSAVLLAYLTFFVLAISPGPGLLGIAHMALEAGRRSAIRLALGLFAGSCVWGVAAAAGIAAVLGTVEQALIAFKIAGGVYLLWLAWRTAKAAARQDEAPIAPSPLAPFLGGVVLQLTNSKSALAWAGAIAIGLPDGAGLSDVLLLLGGCMAISIAVMLAFALLCSAEAVLDRIRRARRAVQAVFAGLFATAGVSLLVWRPA